MDDKSIRVAVISAVATLSLITIYNQIVKRITINKLKKEKFINWETEILLESAKDLDPAQEELIKEQLSRNYLFLGDEGMTKVRSSFVIIVGLGGKKHFHLTSQRSWKPCCFNAGQKRR